jgi:hypothetical protein
MRIKIRVGDIFLDTFNNIDDTFYITEQRYDLRSLEQRKADYTRQIKVPRTNNNSLALDLRSNERLNNPSYPCLILIDDITFLIGFLLITDYSDKEIEIIIFGGNFELFEVLPNRSVSELDLSAYSFPWTQAGIHAIKGNTTGSTSVNTNFFDLESLDDGAGIVANFVNARDIKNWGFGFYLKTLVQEILEQVNYTVNFSAGLTSDDLFDDIVIPCPVILLGSTEDSIFGIVVRATDYVYDASVLLGVPDKVPFTVDTDPSGMWLTDEWTVPTSGDWQVIFDYTITNTYGAELTPATVEILKNSANLDTKEYYLVSNQHQRTVVTFYATAGEKVYIEVTAEYRNATRFDVVTINTAARFSLQQDLPNPTLNLVPQEWLPEMNQREVLLAFLKIFNCLINADPFSKEVNIITWNEYATSEGQDLTKNVLASQEISTQTGIDTYYRESLLTYSNDSIIDRTDTDAEAEFNDATLQQRGQILNQFFSGSDDDGTQMEVEKGAMSFKSATNFTATFGTAVFSFGQVEVFKPGDYIRYQAPTSVNDTIDRVRFATSGIAGQIYNSFPVTVTNVDVQIITINVSEITARIGRIRRAQSIGAQLFTYVNAYTGTSTLVDVNHVTFTDIQWEPLKDAYYKRLFDALRTPKILQVWMTFSTIDFYNLDYSKPVVIKHLNGKYHINKVEQFKLNQPCRVELIRINSFI